jgi:hypothetical protein
MTMVLLTVTCISLIVAAGMSMLAWKLARDEQRRSDARVAHLAAELDTVPMPSSGMGRLLAIAGIGIVVVGILVVGVVSISSSARTPTTSKAAEPPAASAPLELVALGHEREHDRLTVRGIVRDPRGGPSVDRLSAVVFVFGTNGDFVTSSRAAVEPSSLVPGSEATFVVTINNLQAVGRYRVSFRSDDRILAHVDKRERAAIAAPQP